MIAFDNVTKKRSGKGNRRTVLQDVTLEVPGGAHVALLGPEGSGKSTFLHLIGGTDFPDRGEIAVSGRPSWLFGRLNLEKSMTGRENIRFLCRIVGENDLTGVEHFMRDMCDMGRDFDKPYGSYDNEQGRRFNTAASLAFDFDLILADSPLIRGNGAFQDRCRERLENLLQTAQLIVTDRAAHDVSTYCTAAIVIGNGSAQYFDSLDAARAFNDRVNSEQSL